MRKGKRVANKRLGLGVSLILLGALLGPSRLHGDEGYKIVVNVANPVEAISKSEASRIFLTKTTWDTGEPALPVDLGITSPVRSDFSREVLGMTPASVVLHWQRKGGETPHAVATDREVLAYVRLKRGAIGYVSATANVQGVKVIAVTK